MASSIAHTLPLVQITDPPPESMEAKHIKDKTKLEIIWLIEKQKE